MADHANAQHLILGLSAAGATAAETIRRSDPNAEITVLCGESDGFYLRLDLEDLFFGKTHNDLKPRADSFWHDKNIRVIFDRAASLDPASRTVRTTTGAVYSFDHLLIATGARPRDLDVAGRDLKGIVHYHTLADAGAILAARDHVRRAVIIGGGILGLELAHIARHYDWETTLIVRGDFPGSPMVDQGGGRLLRRTLEAAGVRLVLNDEAAGFDGADGQLRAVITRGGARLEADLAGICIGIEPDTDFLKDSGLLRDGQLVADERMALGAPDIFGAGDVVSVQRADGERVKGHTWSVATAQARVAAANMCGGDALWREEVMYDLDTLFGVPFAMIGAWARRDKPGRVLHEREGADYHRSVVTVNGVIESAFLLGNRDSDKRVRKLIAERARVEGKVDRIFDPQAKPEEFRAD